MKNPFSCAYIAAPEVSEFTVAIRILVKSAALAIDVANAYALVRADLEHRGSAIATALQAIGAVVSFGV